MHAVRMLSAFAAVSLLPGCAVSHRTENASLPVRHASWATYQHSPDRNAVFERYAIPHDWSYDSTANINGGLALVANTLLFTSFSRRLVALDVRDGHELWHAELPNIAMTTPIVAGGMVYVGTGRNGVLKRNLIQRIRLIAFDGETGKIRWRFHTSGPPKMSPVVKNGRLYIGDVAGMLYTIDTHNGRLLEIREFKKPFSVSPPIVAGDKLLVVNGTSVDAIPLSGRPDISERVGWGIVSDAQETASP